MDDALARMNSSAVVMEIMRSVDELVSASGVK